MKSAIVLLAAGASTRMGSPKQLLDYGGVPLIRHAVMTALASLCRPVIVVLGSQQEEIRRAIEDLHITIVVNPRWEEGMGTSLQCGIAATEVQGVDGAILALADQPLLTPQRYNELAAEHIRTGKPIVTAEYEGTVGVPVFFARSHFPDLLALEPTQGCKGVILAHNQDAIRIHCPEAAADVDTREQYEKLCALLERELEPISPV